MRLVHRTAPWADPATAFAALYRGSSEAFWLDSSRPGEGARFSFMGDASGPLAATVAYDVEAGEVTVRRGGETEVRTEPILDYLDQELTRLRPGADTDLPFDFQCGFAGYLGYEVKADCDSPNSHGSPHPDAAFVLADRLLAFDHELRQTHLLCLYDQRAKEAADSWIAKTAERLAPLRAAAQGAMGEGSPEPPRCCSADPSPMAPHLLRPRAQYLEDIATCKEHLLEGDSYEICLTNTVTAKVDADPFDLYMELRRVNPAPYASYLQFGELAVLSSSPECFLRIDRGGRVETRPIKGTAPRGDTAAEDARLAEELGRSEKDRAENLMIVDLMRNDLGAVCEVGSVEVPVLMEVESYETVHQLISTVRGRLRPGGTALDCVRSCFPPGSMTGAPKLRTVEILDRLEGRARGVYSGAIGYFGAGGGCDLSVTIRAIVLAGGEASIGAGGAITLQSDAQDELAEALLKAQAPLRALAKTQQTAVFRPAEPSF
ncbi:MAG TPA: aminodeoxychorismate synthase component I [Solirubrobacterales bacterium]|nr:aminodeoxychorismate synthase component I [Solirubrobacterales bacterium]